MPTILQLLSFLIVLSSQISICCSSSSSSSSGITHQVITTTTDDEQQRYLYFDRVIVDIGSNVGMHVKSRVMSYLDRIAHLRVLPVHQFNETSHASVLLFDDSDSCNSTTTTEQCSDMTRGSTLILSLGNTEYSLSKIPQSQLVSLPPESFQIQFDRFEGSPTINININGSAPIYYLACNGLPLNPTTHTNISFDKQHIHYGAVVCAYDALERLGYAFLHPLEPYIPPQLRMRVEFEMPMRTTRSSSNNNYTTDPAAVGIEQQGLNPSADESTAEVAAAAAAISLDASVRRVAAAAAAVGFSVVESPYWPERGFHLHTQHPLELTEVLQGHDIPQFGPHGEWMSG